jgi:hypothetical protein
MPKGAILTIIVGSIILVCIAWITISKDKQIEKIKANPKQTVCKVIGHDIPKKSSDTHYGVWIEYEYTVGGKNYNHKSKYYFPKDDDTYFVGQSFPLIYCIYDPDAHRILIIKDNFEPCGIQQPDSLKKHNGFIW